MPDGNLDVAECNYGFGAGMTTAPQIGVHLGTLTCQDVAEKELGGCFL